METLKNKIDFALIIEVKNANPNGNPLNGNRPRTTIAEYGEISDVCLKRKIRNRLKQEGNEIFLQMQDDIEDGNNSLFSRFASYKKQLEKEGIKDAKTILQKSSEKWIDVRTFGQVFAFAGSKKDETSKGETGAIRGALSIQPAFSVDPVLITSQQITKSANSDETKDGAKGTDTMGTKHRVDFGVYITYGSINTHFAQKNGFTEEDANKIKYALETIFENDCSSARPEGSMKVIKLIWCKHKNLTGIVPSSKVFENIKISKINNEEEPQSINDYKIDINKIDGIIYE